jgi:hypothetical protein
VTTVERADYHPESARWGAALDAVHAVFESDSALVLELVEGRGSRRIRIGSGRGQPRRASRAGWASDVAARRALARARACAEEGLAGIDDDARAETDAEFRSRKRALRALLSE